MEEFSFLNNERLIIKYNGYVKFSEFKGLSGPEELYLTDKNIVYLRKKTFSDGIKDIYRIPVNMISIFNDEPDLHLYKNRASQLCLNIGLKDGKHYEIEFINNITKKEPIKFLNCIYNLLVGHDSNEKSTIDSLVDGAKSLTSIGAGLIGGTAGQVLKSFNDRVNSDTEETDLNEKIVSKCIGCGATISGHKGDVVKCKYCDTKNLL